MEAKTAFLAQKRPFYALIVRNFGGMYKKTAPLPELCFFKENSQYGRGAILNFKRAF